MNPQSTGQRPLAARRTLWWWIVDLLTLIVVAGTVLSVALSIASTGLGVDSGALVGIGMATGAYVVGLLVGFLLTQKRIGASFKRKFIALWGMGSAAILIPAYLAGANGYAAHGTDELSGSVSELFLQVSLFALIYTGLLALVIGGFHHRLGHPGSLLYGHRAFARQVLQAILAFCVAVVAFLTAILVAFAFDPPDEG